MTITKGTASAVPFYLYDSVLQIGIYSIDLLGKYTVVFQKRKQINKKGFICYFVDLTIRCNHICVLVIREPHCVNIIIDIRGIVILHMIDCQISVL